MKRFNIFMITLMLIFGLTFSAHATLMDRGGGMIYDDDLNITWLADANYAKTSGYDADGIMTWSDAMTWADNLVYGGYTDWRLPSALNQDGSGPCYGNYCGSEMGHLYYVELGGTYGSSILTGDPDVALFSNIQINPYDLYWSGTETSYDTSQAWYFDFYWGSQGDVGKDTDGNAVYAWAVRTGDVSPASVPEPATLLLLGSGLAGIVVGRKRLGWK